MTEKLTEKLLREMKPPAKGNSITYDTEVKGFGARITAAGSRAFILNYRIHGRERRFTIGDWPTWSVAAAREEAKHLRKEVDRGIDPLGDRIENREAKTVNDLWLEYERVHLPTKRARSASDDRSMWKTYILPKLRNVKVRDLTPQMVDELHREISETKPVRANRVIEVLRKACNLAIRWEWVDRNPCTGFAKNTEQERQVYLSPEQIRLVAKALEQSRSQASANAIRFMLLTGCRKSEALGATWSMFDLDSGIWTKPSSHTKQKRIHRVPLSGAATELLIRMSEEEDADPVFVFPGSGEAGHLTDVKRTWQTVREAAGIPDVHIHDLRHTFAALLASNAVPMMVLSGLLGHTQAQTTKRYAHLYDDPLRDGAEVAANKITFSRP